MNWNLSSKWKIPSNCQCKNKNTAHCSNSLQRGCQNVPASLDWIHCNFLWNHSLTEFFELVWSKASHSESRKWVFCGIICNLLCKSWKIIHEKSRFKASKTWIIYFFECNGLFRVQNIPFNPKNLHIDFWFDTPLEQCAVVKKQMGQTRFIGVKWLFSRGRGP